MSDEFQDLRLVQYRAGYRYQLDGDYEQWVAAAGIYPAKDPGGNDFVWLTRDGRLLARKGYAWDGASGPAYNDRAFVRPSLTHDLLAQLWQIGIIDDAARSAADRLLGRMLRHDMQVVAKRLPWLPRGVFMLFSYVRPHWVVPAVQLYTRYLARKTANPTLTAP